MGRKRKREKGRESHGKRQQQTKSIHIKERFGSFLAGTLISVSLNKTQKCQFIACINMYYIAPNANCNRSMVGYLPHKLHVMYDISSNYFTHTHSDGMLLKRYATSVYACLCGCVKVCRAYTIQCPIQCTSLHLH